MAPPSVDQEPLANTLIFSGSAHPGLAGEIADYLGLTLSPTVVRQFSNTNLYVHLGVSVRSKEVFVLQPLCPPSSDNLVELLLMLDVARSAGANGVHAVVPYFSYARSDKKDAPRISIAGRLIADLLATAGATHVITMTLHSAQVHGFFSMPTDHLTAHSVFVEYFRKQDLADTVVVSPDLGHADRATKLAQGLGVPVAAGVKHRLNDDTVRIDSIIGEVRDKRVLLVDDEVSTAATLVEIIRMLRRQNVRRMTVIATHGLFTGPAVERLNGIDEINEIVVTNTVPIPDERRPERLTVLSVARIFGEVIRRNVRGESVGQLFEFWRGT